MATTPKTTATRQFASLTLAQVMPARLETLRALLDRINQQTTSAMQGQPLPDAILPFERLTTVHYARFILLEHDPAHGPMLAFSTNYDGPEGEDTGQESRALQQHIDDLIRHARAGLEQVFACCRGYRAGQLAAFLRQHQRAASTFYAGSSGRSRNQILWEAELRYQVDQILDANDFRNTPAEAVRAAVLEQLKATYPTMPPFPPQPDLTGRVTTLQTILVALGLGMGAVITVVWGAWGLVATLLVLGLLVWRFRHLERTDAQFQPQYSDATVRQFRIASVDENRFLQNPLTHLVRIKPGPLRWVLIRVVFAGLHFLAKNRYNKGQLGDIPSIHFASWTLLPNRGVLFLSNFDSSWQSYLGDFIDKASSGLTAVWSNTVGFPRSTWLLTAGARDAARFLAWTRHHQLPTAVWYSAYPGLSIMNINANTEIRRGLADPDVMDATTWLFRLRGVDRLTADQLYSEGRTREPPLPMQDIQGIILWGYGHMPEARYLLFRVARPAPALRTWLSNLPLTSAAAKSKTDAPPEPLLNIAFTYPGLRALALDDTLCAGFSTPFVQGSDDAYRARVNGDVGDDAPERWQWGGPHNPVHLVLLVFASTQNIASFARHYMEEGHRQGLELVQVLAGTTLPGRKEHFGFRDGIAQPIVEGSGRGEVAGNTVPAGEFLLGHRDGYGNVSHSPVSPDGFAFGMNGSYLVLRQLEQNVEAFWRFCAAQPGDDAVTVASKMVGRWPSGAPLVRHPDGDPQSPRFCDQDDFAYLAHDGDNDRYGARCPFGAHIRRTNPRDWQLGRTPDESLQLANLHRILRRGRPYGPPLDDSMSVPRLIQKSAEAPGGALPKRGLQFLCFNAHIERQFEFIQQQWCNNPKFAGQQSDADPLLGPRQPARELGTDEASFTIQSDVKSGLAPRLTHLQHFVRVVGSAYFFMPSLPAVRLLGQDIGRVSVAERLESMPPDEQLHIDSLLDTLREQMRRDYAGGPMLRAAHPKSHGCVRALFTVADHLEASLKAGLFREARTYQAYVRFSNASGTAGPDRQRDIRGVAIKLLGVPGAKLLEGAEQCSTHDFLLISHHTFVTRNVAEFSALVHAMSKGRPRMLLFLLGHPRVARALFLSMQRHANLLDIQYFSAVPALLGAQAVKYSLKPSRPRHSAMPPRPSGNYLRAALKQDLARSAVTFDFMVQPQSDPRSMAIEDASVAWSERAAPFRKVATLEIPAQDFDTPEQNVMSENLSFHPWRCLPEHRPLGGISRARRQIYRALSRYRHDRNTTPDQEPTGW